MKNIQELVKRFVWTYDSEGAFDENGNFGYCPGFIIDPTGNVEMPYQKNEEKRLFKDFIDSIPNDGMVRDGWASNMSE